MGIYTIHSFLSDAFCAFEGWSELETVWNIQGVLTSSSSIWCMTYSNTARAKWLQFLDLKPKLLLKVSHLDYYSFTHPIVMFFRQQLKEKIKLTWRRQ